MGIWLLGVGLELGATFAGTTGKQLVRYSEIVKERCEADTKIVEFAGGGSMGIRINPKTACIEKINEPASPVKTDQIGWVVASINDEPCNNPELVAQNLQDHLAKKEPFVVGIHPMPKGWSRKALTMGVIINVSLSPLLEMAAYTFAPQSTLAPFGGLDTVWNALLAPYTLGEKFTRQRLLGVVIIMTGTIASAFFASQEDQVYTVDSLENLLLRWRVGIYVFSFFGWFAICVVVVKTNQPGSFLRGLALGMMAGTLAGNMFCVKATMELVKTSIANGPGGVWDYWLPYATLAAAIFVGVTNAIMLTKGMQENEALFMVTVFEGSMILANAASGCIVLGDMDENIWNEGGTGHAWKAVCFFLCIVVVVIGLAILIAGEAENSGDLHKSPTNKQSELAKSKSAPPGRTTSQRPASRRWSTASLDDFPEQKQADVESITFELLRTSSRTSSIRSSTALLRRSSASGVSIASRRSSLSCESMAAMPAEASTVTPRDADCRVAVSLDDMPLQRRADGDVAMSPVLRADSSDIWVLRPDSPDVSHC